MSFLYIPVVVFSCVAEPILLMIKMDPNVAKYAQQFIYAQLIGVYFMVYNSLQI